MATSSSGALFQVLDWSFLVLSTFQEILQELLLGIFANVSCTQTILIINQIKTNRFRKSKHNKNKMERGTVKFYNEAKGFGFITQESGGGDIFVHATGVREQIREGDTVEFDLENGKKGLTAVNVRPS